MAFAGAELTATWRCKKNVLVEGKGRSYINVCGGEGRTYINLLVEGRGRRIKKPGGGEGHTKNKSSWWSGEEKLYKYVSWRGGNEITNL